MKTLVCFYDMAVSPCSYDFFTFMYSAEICRIRRSLDDINLILVQGLKNKFRNDEIRSDEQNQTFFDNVILPESIVEFLLEIYGLPETKFQMLNCQKRIFFREDIPETDPLLNMLSTP